MKVYEVTIRPFLIHEAEDEEDAENIAYSCMEEGYFELIIKEAD